MSNPGDPSGWSNRTTEQFRRQLAALPEDAQRQACKAFKLYESNPNHPGLNFERLHTRGEYYSAIIQCASINSTGL